MRLLPWDGSPARPLPAALQHLRAPGDGNLHLPMAFPAPGMSPDGAATPPSSQLGPGKGNPAPALPEERDLFPVLESISGIYPAPLYPPPSSRINGGKLERPRYLFAICPGFSGCTD